MQTEFRLSFYESLVLKTLRKEIDKSMERKLSKDLLDKINALDKTKPYVWALRLSETDFNNLETIVSDSLATDGADVLVQPQNAIITLCYIAEWYKRRYQSGSTSPVIEAINMEKLWVNSGINTNIFVYIDDNGNRRWLYSAYVLGGLAIRHELNRNDKMRFLKALCRIYHGEEYTLENFDEAGRAKSFRESIKREHSLYEYMMAILNGDKPFHADDIANESSEVNRFITIIKTANDEILRDKFRFEWRVTFSPEYNHMTRRLIIWLKPEEVGGGLHQYLRYDRVHLWGVPNPESKTHLYFHIRFKQGDTVLQQHELITYANHSVNDFIAFGVERSVCINNLPTQAFDSIEIIVKDDDGIEYLVQKQATFDYLQLWRIDPNDDVWTSAPSAQKQTALLFSSCCKLAPQSFSCEIFRKAFYVKNVGISALWNWCYIYDSVSILDSIGREQTFYNRNGYDQVTTRLYTGTIKYIEGGKIRHLYIDDLDYSDELECDELPVIFGKDDIIVRHFATKDAILDAQPETDTAPELIEWKQCANYTEWTESSTPPFGQLQLRITSKGVMHKIAAIYLPSFSNEHPIQRDYEGSQIHYRDLNGETKSIEVNIPKDGKELKPTVTISLGVSDNYYELEVFLPTLIKEVILDGKLIQYLEADEQLNLPYIFKTRVRYNDFSTRGYQAYDCSNLSNIYTSDFINVEGNPSSGMAALAAWKRGSSYKAYLLDAQAPESLNVCFGLTQANSCWDNSTALAWNYDCHSVPTQTDANAKLDFGVVYQDLSKVNNLVCNFPLQYDDDVWGFDDVEVDIVKCFEAACDAGTYFFLMRPLMDLRKEDVIKELYNPLLALRDGNLTETDRTGLMRFAEEFGFSWEEYKITIDK